MVGVIHAKDEADAIRLANDTVRLSAAVLPATRRAACGVARQMLRHLPRQGPTVHDEPQMPFESVGASGYGRFGGKAGIEQFTELRWITIETQRVTFP